MSTREIVVHRSCVVEHLRDLSEASKRAAASGRGGVPKPARLDLAPSVCTRAYDHRDDVCAGWSIGARTHKNSVRMLLTGLDPGYTRRAPRRHRPATAAGPRHRPRRAPATARTLIKQHRRTRSRRPPRHAAQAASTAETANWRRPIATPGRTRTGVPRHHLRRDRFATTCAEIRHWWHRHTSGTFINPRHAETGRTAETWRAAPAPEHRAAW